jgi:hypothetical protein
VGNFSVDSTLDDKSSKHHLGIVQGVSHFLCEQFWTSEEALESKTQGCRFGLEKKGSRGCSTWI